MPSVELTPEPVYGIRRDLTVPPLLTDLWPRETIPYLFIFVFIEPGSLALVHSLGPQDWLILSDLELTNEDMKTFPLI